MALDKVFYLKQKSFMDFVGFEIWLVQQTTKHNIASLEGWIVCANKIFHIAFFKFENCLY